MSKAHARGRSAERSPSGGGSAARARPAPSPGLGRSNAAVQAKLRVGSRDDPLERAADRAAAEVLSGGLVESPGTAPVEPQRNCAECEAEAEATEEETVRRQMEDENEEEEEELLQPKAAAAGARAGGAEAAAAAVAGGGRPLSARDRAYFEPRFGRDFSAVRIHDGQRVRRAAAAINARAYTLGTSIAFASGEHRPETPAGRRLLAHELAHVVQQTGGAAAGPGGASRPVGARSRREGD